MEACYQLIIRDYLPHADNTQLEAQARWFQIQRKASTDQKHEHDLQDPH